MGGVFIFLGLRAKFLGLRASFKGLSRWGGKQVLFFLAIFLLLGGLGGPRGGLLGPPREVMFSKGKSQFSKKGVFSGGKIFFCFLWPPLCLRFP